MMYKAYDDRIRRSNEADYKAFIKKRFWSVFEHNNCQSVLDVGCGQGVLLDLLSEAGLRGVGIEMDEDFVKDLHQRGHEVHAGDALQVMESITEKFDGVFIAHLIEHFQPAESVKLLNLAHKVLNPGGIVMVVTPNVQSIIQHVQIFYRDYTHVRFYPADLIEFLMEHVGFEKSESCEIEESTYLDPQKVTPVGDRPKAMSTRMPSLTDVGNDRQAEDRIGLGDATGLPELVYEEQPEKLASKRSYGFLPRLIRRWLGIEELQNGLVEQYESNNRSFNQLIDSVQQLNQIVDRGQQLNKQLATSQENFSSEVTKTFEAHQTLLTKYVEHLNDLVAKTINTQDMVLRHAEVVNFLLRNTMRPNDIYVIARKPLESTE